MAGEVSKEALESILVHAKFAAKTVRPQRDRLLEVRRRLQQQLKPSDDDIAAGLRESALDAEHILPNLAATLNNLAVERMKFAVTMKHCDLASEISKVYYDGMKDSARAIATCLELAAKSGARLDLLPAFAAMPDEQLHDALLAQQRLPARPTTQTEAFARVEAAFYAVRLCKEHHILSCIEHLVGVRATLVTDEPEDPVDATTEHVAKTDLSDPAPAAADTHEPPQAAANPSVDVDKARDYLDRACTLASLAVNHIDLAVAAITSLVDPTEVASMCEFTDTAASISEVTSVFD
ncbi:uncharacterized protein [Lolium perenne]|uniref:uncharacterized protein n=1 Tax=Lolium perenne TaxID=4522 RepID=UPI0021F58906|nr:uncharacterized protein LOC127338029 [Lolium perenne]